MPDHVTDLAQTVHRETARSAAQPGEPAVTDRELMALAQGGDRDAYGRLFQRCAPGVWQMAYLLLHDAGAAEDVVQEAFTLGLEHAAGFRGEAEPKRWFCSIALNVCRQAWRRKEHREVSADPALLEDARAVGPPRRGVMTSLLRHEASRRLAIALGYLTEPQREVFVLHYVEGLSYDDLAEVLGTNAGAARALSHRARAILRDKLRGRSADATTIVKKRK